MFQARAVIDSSLQMQLGNPSGAIVDTNNHEHYLIQRTVEALDYSDHYGQPLWASWDLTAADVGSATRSTTYYTDTNLPPNFTRVTDNDYNGVGAIDFNRGHLCPSEDRTDTAANNKLVFFMSNIMPQSAPDNQGVWATFENYCRTLLTSNELLVICGPSGFGTNKIPSGKAYIGSNTWKIAVCVPLGSGTALSRISLTNRVIAINVPNVTNGLVNLWQKYVCTPADIERDTGFTFFTALSPAIAANFRSRNDAAPVLSNFTVTNRVVQFNVNGWAGTNYVVLVSTNLALGNWFPVATNAAPFVFTRTNPVVASQFFYRARF